MSRITIEDPNLYVTKEVDSSGRVYLGKDWAGKDVKIAVEVVEESEADEGNPDRMTPTTAD